MRLAPAKLRDAAPLARVMSAWAEEMPWMPTLHTPEEDALLLRRLIDTSDVITLRNWRGPQGFLARDGEMIHGLYLSPAARGRGHGARLLENAKARSPRLTLWVFQANLGALRFYASQGFTEVEATDGRGNDQELPDVRLVWQRGRLND